VSRTFNLVDERWIPCIKPDGGVTPAGILRTLVDAEQYAEVRDSSPLVTVAVHRLLLAILHRVFGPESPEAWADLWQNGAGRFDEKKLEAYLKEPAIYSRFDLFDQQHPFYQTASLPLGPPDKKTRRPKFVKPIWLMAHELAYSDNMNLFAHFTENDWETRPATEVARWLIAFQAFAHSNLVTTEEGKKKEHGSADAAHLVKSAVVLAKGDNLFQTLMLNLVHYSEQDEEPFVFKASRDKPAWELDEPVRPEDRPFDGYLDLLTWQNRRVKLVPERDQTGELIGVTGVVVMRGWQLPGYLRHGRETMVGFIRAQNAPASADPWPPLGFRPDRELWRDSHALLQSVAQKSERPKNLKWLDDLRQLGYLDRAQIQIEVSGMSSSTAKILFWRHETFPLPIIYLAQDRPDLINALEDVIRLADRVEEALQHAVWRAVVTALKPAKDEQRLGKTERDAVEQMVKSLETKSLFWSRLEEPFRRRLLELAGEEVDRSKVVYRWFTETLQPAATDAYRRTGGEMEYSSRALRAAVSGEETLHRELARIAVEHRFVADTARKETRHAGVGP
jgi:CRISPR system Cascade subunit CasA